MRALAVCILIVGLAAGTAIYVIAADEPQPTSSSYVVVVDPTTTKTYVRELQRFGGKTAVLFDEVNRWFASRWHGKALGVTIGWISSAAAALIYWIGGRLR
jgi:hypothetical protein